MLAFALVGLLSAVHAQPVPLPNLPDGFRIGNGPLIVDAFLDMLCPDCAADFPTFTSLLPHYGATKISLVLHTFPLPYHSWAFRAAQGAHVIASLNTTSPGAAAFAYAAMMFENQGDFYGADLNQTWVDNHIAELAASQLGYSASAVAAGLADDNLNEDTRISWKYSTSRYSTGTPHYMVNGLPVDDQLGNGQLSDWEALLDPLLAGAAPQLPKALSRFANSKDLSRAAKGKDL